MITLGARTERSGGRFEDEELMVRRLIRRRLPAECAREPARSGRTAPAASAVAPRWGCAGPAHCSRAFRGV